MARTYTEYLRTRVTPAQLAQIEEDAAVYGKSVCGYVRDRLIGKRLYAQTDQQVLNELRRIGGLIKHVRAPLELQTALDRIAERIK